MKHLTQEKEQETEKEGRKIKKKGERDPVQCKRAKFLETPKKHLTKSESVANYSRLT